MEKLMYVIPIIILMIILAVIWLNTIKYSNEQYEKLVYVISVFLLIVAMTVSAIGLYDVTQHNNEQQVISYSHVDDAYKCRKQDTSFKNVINSELFD